jgi:glucose-1-phosphate cytidylyltransferase
MKVVILAGGLGTRLMEETEARPKPMVEIGGKPILWHIMKIYEHHGFNDFIICLGYKAQMIKEYFLNYYLYNSDVTIELEKNNIEVHYSNTESFKVTLIDTGLSTNTAGRLKRVQKYVGNETFMLTYGDGLSDVDLRALMQFHQSHGKLATLTSVQIPGKFGNLEIAENGVVKKFQEKPEGDGFWINGGFFVLSRKVTDYVDGNESFEYDVLPRLVAAGELMSFKHTGFWQPMDTLKDRQYLENLMQQGKLPWS